MKLFLNFYVSEKHFAVTISLNFIKRVWKRESEKKRKCVCVRAYARARVCVCACVVRASCVRVYVYEKERESKGENDFSSRKHCLSDLVKIFHDNF